MVKYAIITLVGCTTANPLFCPTGENPDGSCMVDCVGDGDAQVCLQAAPTGPKTLADLDTTTGCDEIVALGCIVSATDLTIDHHVLVRGSRPVILFATGTLTIAPAGSVDASGSDQPGAGGNVACAAGTAPTSAGMHGGGGAGGSFARPGGNGGAGGAQSAGGIAAPAITVAFRGGCNGGEGADGSMPSGAGGFAGGAVYLAGGHAIAISGSVLAAGGGGGGGIASRGGGGGGASGGSIFVATPTLTVTPMAMLVANGGGGGGGATNNLAGLRGATATTIGEPHGGLGVASGGSGGYGMAAATVGGASGDGGGGGGGGAGAIRVFGGGSLAGAQVSPPAN